MTTYQFKKALFPFSADPPHKGHRKVIERALEFCERLVVLVVSNEGKKHTFSLEKRLQLTELLVNDLPGRDRIEIRSSDGLMCDEFLRFGCDALIRGVRDARDQVYEEEYVAKQALLFPWFSGTPVIAITAHGDKLSITSTIAEKDEMKHISSTVIRAAVQAHLPVDRFVSLYTQQCLEEEVNGQYKIGVTGTIASGKSTVVAQMTEHFMQRGIKAYSIAIDELVREIYADPCDGCQKMRDQLAERFGERVLTDDRKYVDRIFLKTQLFGSPEARENRRWVEDLTRPHVQRLYRDKLRDIRRKDPRSEPQLVILEWAQPVSAELSLWSNGNMIVIDTPAEERLRGALSRQISHERLVATLEVQGETQDLIAALKERTVRDRCGEVLVFNNRWLASDDVVAHDRAWLGCRIREFFPRLVTS